MISRSKLVTLLLTGALVVGVGVAGIVGPAAASGSGTAYVTPGAGNPDTALTMNTNGYCPAGDTNGDVQVSGTGVTTSHPYIYGNSALPVAGVSGYSVAMSQTMSTFASEQNPPATLSGTYVFTFNCLQTSTSLSPDHVFVGTIVFQGSGNDSTNTYTNTATTLAASPSRSAASRSDVTFTATVSPANAAGQVQFMDGTTDLGAPVKVSGGRAVYETSALAAGSHRITATFGPLRSDSSGSWGPSAVRSPSLRRNRRHWSGPRGTGFRPDGVGDCEARIDRRLRPGGCPRDRQELVLVRERPQDRRCDRVAIQDPVVTERREAGVRALGQEQCRHNGRDQHGGEGACCRGPSLRHVHSGTGFRSDGVGDIDGRIDRRLRPGSFPCDEHELVLVRERAQDRRRDRTAIQDPVLT